MPKRMVDGEALWLSNKLLQVPEHYRAEYANLIPLALANGTFECDARKIWSRVYVYNRPSLKLESVEEILNSFERAKMLFRWQVADGSTWGYWVGIDKPGRLPKGTDCKNAAKGQPVPADQLQEFISNGNRPLTGQNGAGKSILLGVASSESTPEPIDETALAVERVWGYYIEQLEKNPKILTFTHSRKKKGVDRLRECLAKTGHDLTKAEGLMRCAVDVLAASAWHMGENPSKKRYDSWEKNLFKSQEQLEEWLAKS
jgi:hypothetical protein